MKIVTFNIRLDTVRDGKLGYPYRKPFILRTVREKNADILCFQEVLPHVAADLKQVLGEYMVLGVGRDEKLRDEQMTVAFRKDRYNLMQMETFWLSGTPNIPGSRYEEQSICPRCCTAVLLEEIETGKVFRVINTHLDHIGVKARVLGLTQILRWVNKAALFPNAPVLLAGDFNAEPNSEELKVFEEFPGWRNLTENMGITFHDFGRLENAETIDYIFGRGPWVLKDREKWTEREGELYLSDHYPLCVEVELN